MKNSTKHGIQDCGFAVGKYFSFKNYYSSTSKSKKKKKLKWNLRDLSYATIRVSCTSNQLISMEPPIIIALLPCCYIQIIKQPLSSSLVLFENLTLHGRLFNCFLRCLWITFRK